MRLFLILASRLGRQNTNKFVLIWLAVMFLLLSSFLQMHR